MIRGSIESDSRYPGGNFEQTRLLLRSSWQRLNSSRPETGELRRRFQLTQAAVEETQKRIEQTDRLIACVRSVLSLSPDWGDDLSK